jgi:hypothetical protein
LWATFFRKAPAFYDLHMAQSSPRDEIGFNPAGAGALHPAALATMVKHEPRRPRRGDKKT